MFAELTRILNHLLNVTTYALDVGAITPRTVGLRAARAADGILRGGRRQPLCTRTTSAPAACDRTCPPGWLERIAGWCSAVPEIPRGPRGAADRQPHLQAAHRRYRHHDRRAGDRMGLLGAAAARLGRAVGPAQVAALRDLRPTRLRHPGRRARATATTATWSASGDAPGLQHRGAVPGAAEAGPGARSSTTRSRRRGAAR